MSSSDVGFYAHGDMKTENDVSLCKLDVNGNDQMRSLVESAF